MRSAVSMAQPMLSRGGGTSLAGQCCNIAVVMDWSKYLNHVLEVDPDARKERVCSLEPFLTTYAAGPKSTTSHSALILPRTTTAPWEECSATTPAASTAQMAGKTVDNTEELEILTYDGLRMRVGWMTRGGPGCSCHQGGRQGEIFSRDAPPAGSVRRSDPPAVSRKFCGEFPVTTWISCSRRDGRFNVARALVGIRRNAALPILEAKLRLVHSPPKRTLVVVGYPDIYSGRGSRVPEILASSILIGFEAD